MPTNDIWCMCGWEVYKGNRRTSCPPLQLDSECTPLFFSSFSLVLFQCAGRTRLCRTGRCCTPTTSSGWRTAGAFVRMSFLCARRAKDGGSDAHTHTCALLGCTRGGTGSERVTAFIDSWTHVLVDTTCVFWVHCDRKDAGVAMWALSEHQAALAGMSQRETSTHLSPVSSNPPRVLLEAYTPLSSIYLPTPLYTPYT